MKTLLVALLLLVVGTGTASAECAWVLWNGLKGGDGAMRWQRFDAFDARTGCVRAIDRRAAQLGLSPGNFYNGLGFRMSETVLDEDVFRATWQCLPSDVDPRGPKGK